MTQTLDKNTPIVDVATGRPTPQFQRFWQLNFGKTVNISASTGWQALTGTGLKTTYAVYTSPTINATYTPSQIQALSDQVAKMDGHIKAIIDGLIAAKVFST